MATLKHIHGYLYDIFEKEKIREIIDHFNQTLGPSKEMPIAITVLGSGKNVRQEKNHWIIEDIQEALNTVEEVCKKRLPADVSMARTALKKIEILTVESEELPYSLLMLYFVIDESKVDLEKLFPAVQQILHPLRIYLEDFSGIVRGLFGPKPICPYFIDVGIQSTSMEIKKMVQTASEILQAGTIPHENLMQSYVLPRASELRKIAPISSLQYQFNLLSIPIMFGNQVTFVGHVEQPALNGLMTTCMITYFENDFWPDNIDPNSFLTISSSGYDGLLTPWSHAGTIIYLQSMYAWLLKFDRSVGNLESELVDLRKKIRELLKVGKESPLEEPLAELDKNGSDIVNLISEIGQLKRRAETTIHDFSRGRSSSTVEIPIPPATKSDFYFWMELREKNGSGAYLQSIAIKIENLMAKIMDVLEQYNYENEKLHDRVNNFVNLRIQHTMKKHSQIMLIATGVIGALAFATLVVSFLGGLTLDEIKNVTDRQSEIEDSYSTIIIPDVVYLSTGNYHSYYTKGINVTAYGAHPIHIEIVNASVYPEDLGRCFFAKGTVPTMELSSTAEATVKDQTTTIVPMFYGNYEVNGPFYWYSNDKGENYDIGRVYLGLITTDESNPLPKSQIVETTLEVKLPPNLENMSNCN